MSDQEQYQIIGRTVVEQKEAKRRLAALEAKARSCADCMRVVSQQLSPAGVMYTGTGSGFSGRTLASAIEEYPDRAEVVALLEEIRVTKDRIEGLSKALTDMAP